MHYARRAIRNALQTAAAKDSQYDEISLEDCPTVTDIADEVSSEEAEKDIDSLYVRRWIASLPAQFKRLFELLYMEDLCQQEAAFHLGVSQPRVAQMKQAFLQLAKREFGFVYG